ncbi:MAG: hypothetical protein ACRD3N_11340 [Terracidiphilus sp.]
MAVSWSKSFIASNPRFELTQPESRPRLQTGQMTIVYECLDKLGRPSLSELVKCCEANGYKTKKEIKLSVLYQLKLMEDGTINRIKHAQRQVVRVL